MSVVNTDGSININEVPEHIAKQYRFEVIAASVNKTDNPENEKPIYTVLLEYPRFIHAEFMTHKMLGKNAASSRAIPTGNIREIVRNSLATPLYWSKQQKGMQSGYSLSTIRSLIATYLWVGLAYVALGVNYLLEKLGVHKQHANRILEVFSNIRVVCTGTEWENFFALRTHFATQPELQYLAINLKTAMDNADAVILREGEWHTPYYGKGYWKPTRAIITEYGKEVLVDDALNTLDVALKISASCTAQTSFRKADTSIAKAKNIFNLLIESKPVHASPTEHQATPIPELDVTNNPDIWPAGVTHMDRNRKLWSANLKGWIQHRKLIPDNSVGMP